MGSWKLGTRVLAALALCVAWCAPRADAQTLRVWGSDQLAEADSAEIWGELKATFEKAHPGVKVEYIQPTGTISNGAVQAAIQSSAGPDVLLTNSGIGRVGIVARAKLVRPLTAQYEAGWSSRLYPWLYADLRRQFGGEIYEVPDGLDAIGLWYHKDLMAARGWKVPGTYTEMLALFDEIKKAGIFPLIVGPRSNFNGGHLYGALMQATAGKATVGKVVYNEEPWTQPDIVQAATRLTDLVEKGYIPREAVSLDLDGATRLWFSKRAMFIVAGPWLTNNARKAGFNLAQAGYVPMPSDRPGESLPTGGIGWSWMIPTSSKQPELATAWLDFLLSDEAMLMRARHRTSWMVYPRELPPFEPSVAALKDVYAAADRGVGYNPSVYVQGNVLDTYYQVIQGLIGRLVTPQDGMAMIQQQAGARRP